MPYSFESFEDLLVSGLAAQERLDVEHDSGADRAGSTGAEADGLAHLLGGGTRLEVLDDGVTFLVDEGLALTSELGHERVK